MTHEILMSAAAEAGSKATTLRGAIRYLADCPRARAAIKTAVRRASRASRLTPAEWREHAEARVRDARTKRNLATGKRSAELRLLRREYAAIAHADDAAAAAAQLETVNRRRQLAGLPALPAPATIIGSIADLIRCRGPIPAGTGAGKLIETAVVRDVSAPLCTAWDDYGDQGSVPAAYRYPVKDHYVRWTIPRGWTVAEIGGLVTALPAGLAHRRAPVRAYIAEKSRGYSGKWTPCRVYRDYHETRASVTDAQIVAHVDSARAARVQKARDQRSAKANLRSLAQGVWITEQALRAIGACAPGIENGKRQAMSLLGATGDLGAVSASWALAQGGQIAHWARRCVLASQQ